MAAARLAPWFGLTVAALAVLWTLAAGKDLNWDLLNHHLYLGEALLRGRLAQDFFAASAQGYLNPAGYLPLALLTDGMHAVIAQSLLALAHSLAALLVLAIAAQVVPGRPVLALAGALLGLANPIFLALVGTSFLEPLVVLPMLAATLLLVRAPDAGAPRRTFAAGLLFGVAAALKVTNMVFALAGCLLAAMAAPRARALLACAGGGLLAALAFAAPWHLQLWREYGNPFFPLFNHVFGSPDFPPIDILHDRFRPDGLLEALAWPLRALLPDPMIYAEIRAPDLRPAAALVLCALALVALVRGRVSPASPGVRLALFTGVSFALWLATSANGRYGLLPLMLLGPVIVWAASTLPRRAQASLVAVLLLAQAGMLAVAGGARWSAERWSATLLPAELPAPLIGTPAFYFTVETQTWSALVPRFHAQSSFVNLRGQHSLVPGEHGWYRVQGLERRHAQAYVVARGLRSAGGVPPDAEAVAFVDATLVWAGYRVDAGRCLDIMWREDDTDALSRLANRLAGEPRRRAGPLLGVCALVPAQPSATQIEGRERARQAFDRIERECAALLRGGRAVDEPLGAEWARSYGRIESRLVTSGGRVLLAPWFALWVRDLGALADWASGQSMPVSACLPTS